MNCEWKTVKLGDCCILNSSSYSSRDNWEEINYLDTANLLKGKILNLENFIVGKDKIPSRAKRKVILGDVLYSTVRPNQCHYGIIKKSYENLIVSTGFCVLTSKQETLSPFFLYYYLTQNNIIYALQAIAEQSTSTYPSIRPKDILNLEICLPPLETQKKIANILSKIDDKIELNNKINENLEAQAQAIFKSWFIDFEPFGGVMPSDWKKDNMLSITNELISGDWGKDSPVGNNNKEVYCIRGADIPSIKKGSIGKMPTRYILNKNYQQKKLSSGDLVVEISGGSPTQSTGRSVVISNALLDRYNNSLVCTNFCKAVKPKLGYSMLLYFYMQYLYNKNVFFVYENGTTGIKNLDLLGLLESEIINIPNQSILDSFNHICDGVFNYVYKNGKENERLAELRDSLLPKLMSGELDVSKVEI